MTDVELTQLLSTLTETAALLNRESDSMTELIKDLNTRLQTLNIGIEVWPITLDEEMEPDEDRDRVPVLVRNVTQLGYAKVGDTWSLAVRQVQHDDGDWSTISAPMSLLHASRDLRLKAMAKLPVLLQELQYRAQGAVNAIQTAKKLLKK